MVHSNTVFATWVCGFGLLTAACGGGTNSDLPRSAAGAAVSVEQTGTTDASSATPTPGVNDTRDTGGSDITELTRGTWAGWPTGSWSAQMELLGLGVPVAGTTELLTLGGSSVTDAAVIAKTPVTLSLKNAAEHANLPGYIATGKSNCCENQERVPFRTYSAACAVDSNEPRMFVSMTLSVEDENSIYHNPRNPRIGSVFEATVDDETGALVPTGNLTLLPVCNEAHGIAVSADCTSVGVMCATSFEEPFSSVYQGNVVDLTGTPDVASDTSDIVQPNNQEDYPNYTGDALFAGEMWLLEWSTSKDTEASIDLSEAPAKYVIHRSFGGQPLGSAYDLVYNDNDNTYGTVIPASTFKSTGRRHRSAAMLVVDRDSSSDKAIDGWQLNPEGRGWPWECGYGHVMHARVFWNPFLDNSITGTNGGYGALCTTDYNRYDVLRGGNIGVKYENESTTIAGDTHYFVPSSSIGVTGGAGHAMLPVNEKLTLGIATAIDIEEPEGWGWYEATKDRISNSDFAISNGYTWLQACEKWDDAAFCGANLAYEWEYTNDGQYPVFYQDAEPRVDRDGNTLNTSDWLYAGTMDKNDLNKIGLFKSSSADGSARNNNWENGAKMKWLAQDDDCTLAAPQIVDLKNGRYLVGYAKFQCISDGWEHSRLANAGNHKREEAMRIPSAYYLMEIDAQGNVLVGPTAVAAGWGGADKIISLGEGKAAWLYVADATLAKNNTSYPEPSQSQWALYVYESRYR